VTQAASWIDELNNAQRRAVESSARSLLVVAGAGTGKTKTLAGRVAYVIERGTRPERILLLTFTRRAAREMLRRAERLVGQRADGRVWGGTFHSVANRLLRERGRALGLSPGFTVLDAADAAGLLGLVRADLGLGAAGRRFPGGDTLSAIYSRMVNARAPLTDVLEKWFPWCTRDIDGIRAVFRGFVDRKARSSLLDYDDLLLYWNALASAHSQSLRGRFDYILVDEYQDTNALQADILVNMRDASNSIMAVGDDAQAIYSFRSASVQNILEFPDRHPGTEIVKLERNYRSTQPILRATNAVIAQARRRYPKNLWSESPSDLKPGLITCIDEAQQSDAVCNSVLEERETGVRLRDQTVLFRAGHHSALLEIELGRRNIPFVKYGGLKFVEAAHVKDVLCWLRLLDNPYDELSWFRVLQRVEGIGSATARRIMSELGVDSQPPAQRSPLVRFVEEPPATPPAAHSDVERLRGSFAECMRANLDPASELGRSRGFYEPVFARVYDSARSRLADLEQLERIAGRYPTRARFLSDLALDPPQSTEDLAADPLLDEDYLTLSTIHSAKGGEWDSVHVIHASDGMIPSDMALSDADGLDEELRLFYVALTRAKRSLRVFFPLRYYHRRAGLDDAHSYAQLTRFLPARLHDLFASVSLEPAASSDEREGAWAVGAAVERLWAS
jgi:DNA helicase-2/ATP-dependent DNA helicase PcrA